MAYRDETEALRSRVTDLERELDDARAVIARMRGGESPHASLAARLLGAPLTLVDERAFSGSVDDEALGEVVDALAKAYGTTGDTSQVGRRLTWSHTVNNVKIVEVTLMGRHDKVELRGKHNMGTTAAVLYFALLMPLALVATLVLLIELKIVGLILGLWLLLCGWLATRALLAARAREHGRKLRIAMDGAAAIVKQSERVRVAPSADEAEEEEANAEAERGAGDEAAKRKRRRRAAN